MNKCSFTLINTILSNIIKDPGALWVVSSKEVQLFVYSLLQTDESVLGFTVYFIGGGVHMQSDLKKNKQTQNRTNKTHPKHPSQSSSVRDFS